MNITKYPIKHPILLKNVEPWTLLSEVPEFGVVKCRVEAPRKLYLSVWSMEFKNQLIFPLCGKYHEKNYENNEGEHNCTCVDRSFITTCTFVNKKTNSSQL
uniref:Uncharacterized protein n=1 Tax=Panagrolaimus davidi TaxID=227884 RepID=A0A914PJL1_9BILA